MTLGLWDGRDVSFSLLMRSIIESHPFQVVGALAGVSLSMLWYSLVVCERPAGGAHASYGGGVWMIFIAAFTMGYGDSMPVRRGQNPIHRMFRLSGYRSILLHLTLSLSFLSLLCSLSLSVGVFRGAR